MVESAVIVFVVIVEPVRVEYPTLYAIIVEPDSVEFTVTVFAVMDKPFMVE